MTQITVEDLERIRKENPNKKIVFCSGTFDLTHAGHVLFFEDCKKYGDILVVSVGCDDLIKNYKGKERPILNEIIRLKTVDSFKPVNYCLLDWNYSSNGTPLDPVLDMMKLLKPDYYVINEDSWGIPLRKEKIKEMEIKLVILDRYCPKEFERISTSKIIEKIKKLDA